MSPIEKNVTMLLSGNRLVCSASKSSPASVAQNITVLTATSCNTVKTFRLDENGQLQCIQYGNESLFTYKLEPIQGIEQFAGLLTALSKQNNAILIRGFPAPPIFSPTVRTKEKFPEGNEGRYWVMLDFDNQVLPEGMNPSGIEAVECIVSKLPKEFHGISYFYQFSSSSGILNERGEPLKTGLNVHLFFWFKHPIHGKKLSAYLELHCYQTGFFAKARNRDEMPVVKPGVDLSVIRSSVQPHYIGLPILGAGVNCTLPMESRQGFKKKKCHAVELPEMSGTLLAEAISARKRFGDEWKRECGFVPARITTRAAHGGISVSTYHRNPNGASPSTNRVFLEAKPYGEDAVILYFEAESSPGSFFVKEASPQLAVRFGDYDTIPLKELSEGAYAYIRDDLKWFSEISHFDLELDGSGYMPDIQSFATARNALILSPTGTGKTESFCRYAEVKYTVIIYAAQTIALVDQMYEKLKYWKKINDKSLIKTGLRVIRYTNFYRGEKLEAGVIYVTTNQSLKKFIEAALVQGIEYDLVIDEVHVALDDFMVSENMNRLLEKAIARASRSIFMTGTITNLQISKLMDTISRSCGALTTEMFASYQFQPVKSNPLFLADVSCFGADFVALLRQYQALKKDGKPIPRTVIITPTTRMRAFEMLLEAFELHEDSCVVSRQESLQDEIEVARTSKLPILVSSPLFALGLNLEVEPVRFWTYFSYLQVDESQIIQTLNRANRGQVQCEVRLYFGEADDMPVMIPKADLERIKIDEYFRDEASVQGLLDGHFLVDRATYLSMRNAEKSTAKSLSRLIESNGFQNYHIENGWVDTLDADKKCEQVFKAMRKKARDTYLDDVDEQGDSYGSESDSLLLYQLEKLYQMKKAFGDEAVHVQREIEHRVRGVCMALCDVTAEESAKVKPGRIRRLFGDLEPFVSSQYSRERSDEWRAVAAEKTLALIPLLEALKKLRDGELNGCSFAARMKRVSLGAAVKALADHERNFIELQGKLDRLEEISDLIRNKASENQKVGLRAEQFEIAQNFLGMIGVNFEKYFVGKKAYIDPNKPIVPSWDFDLMIAVLERKAYSLKRLPNTSLNLVNEHERWVDANVSIELCANCVHCDRDFLCAVGRPIQPFWDDTEPTTKACDAYRKIPARLEAW